MYDVEDLNTTTGVIVVGFGAGVGSDSVGVGGSLVATNVGVGMGPSSVGVGDSVGLDSAVGVGTSVGCSAGARVVDTLVRVKLSEGAATSLLHAANNTRPDRLKPKRFKRRRDNKLGISYSDFTKSAIERIDSDTTIV